MRIRSFQTTLCQSTNGETIRNPTEYLVLVQPASQPAGRPFEKRMKKMKNYKRMNTKESIKERTAQRCLELGIVQLGIT